MKAKIKQPIKGFTINQNVDFELIKFFKSKHQETYHIHFNLDGKKHVFFKYSNHKLNANDLINDVVCIKI